MGEVGTKLVFENDRVKVWEFTLAPGESIDARGCPRSSTKRRDTPRGAALV
jgi:hypothetical protein